MKIDIEQPEKVIEEFLRRIRDGELVEVKYAYNETFSEETRPLFTCSECGYEEFEDNQHFRYCPHCGRKIRRKNDVYSEACH